MESIVDDLHISVKPERHRNPITACQGSLEHLSAQKTVKCFSSDPRGNVFRTSESGARGPAP
jgi:hypothetical protein